MSVVTLQERLQRRYDQAQERFATYGLEQPPTNDRAAMEAWNRHPATIAFHREMNALYKAGFHFPQPDGVYVMPSYAQPPRNLFQAVGRELHFKSPHRFHFLLPYLGEQVVSPRIPPAGPRPQREKSPAPGGN